MSIVVYQRPEYATSRLPSVTNAFDTLEFQSQPADGMLLDLFSDNEASLLPQLNESSPQFDQKAPDGPPWVCDLCEIGPLKNRSELKYVPPPQKFLLQVAVANKSSKETQTEARKAFQV